MGRGKAMEARSKGGGERGPGDAPILPAEGTPRSSRRWAAFLLALPILALVAWAYAPVVDAGFIWDDDDYVVLNDLLVEEGGLREIWNPRSPRNPQYYPLVFTTFRLERALYGLDPTGYHVDNVVLYAANALLLLFLLRRVRFPGAWLAAAIFALHPVHVESVAWITERKNVLSGLFYFLSAHAYLTFDSRRKGSWYALALACFLLALTAKTVTASLPIALGLLLWWKRGRIDARQLATLAPMVAIGFVMGLLTRSHESTHVISSSSELHDLTLVDRALIAGRALWFYPWKLLWPKDLAFIYERWDVDPQLVWPWIFPLAAAAVLAVALLAYRLRRLPRGPLAAMLFYGVTIFPALGFVVVAPMRFSYVADHFQYIASIGVILIVVALLHAALERVAIAPEGRALALVSAVLAIALAVLARSEVAHYRDLGTLWAHTARTSPTNAMVLNQYANWLRKQTDSDPARQADLRETAAGLCERSLEHSKAGSEEELLALCNLAAVRFDQERYEESASAAERAVALKPDFPGALNVYGRAVWKLGRPEEAERTLEKILEVRPNAAQGRHAWDLRRRTDDASVNRILGLVRRDLKKWTEAERAFERAIEIDPDLHEAYVDLGGMLGSDSRFEEAAQTYRRLLARDPPAPMRAYALQQLGFSLKFLGRHDEAIAAFGDALEVAPQDVRANRARIETLIELRRFGEAVAAVRAAIEHTSDAAGYKHRLAWLLATAPDDSVRDGAEALAIAQELERSSQSALTLSVLAAAQAEQGDFDAALETARRAEAVAQGALVEQVRGQVRDYERATPTRLP